MMQWCDHIKNSKPLNESDIYTQLHSQFILQLINTKIRCRKYCASKYNQERNLSVAKHPVIESDLLAIDKIKALALQELKDIDNIYETSAQRIQALVLYAKEIINLRSSSLFVVILAGKLKTRWWPRAQALVDVEQIVSCQMPSQCGPA